MTKDVSIINGVIAIDFEKRITSRQLADTLEARHDNILRSIDRAIAKEALSIPPLEERFDTVNGREVRYFELDFISTMVILTGYDILVRKKIIDRWFALETGQAKPAFDMQRKIDDFSKLIREYEHLTDLYRSHGLTIKDARLKASDTLSKVCGKNFITEVLDLDPKRIGKNGVFKSPSEDAPVHHFNGRDYYSMAQLAHRISMKEKDFINLLCEMEYLIKGDRPGEYYAKACNTDLFFSKEDSRGWRYFDKILWEAEILSHIANFKENKKQWLLNTRERGIEYKRKLGLIR